MNLAIVSDIHANLEALRATLQDISKRSVDRIVCLGDIVGYNANPEECVALLRQHDPLCVAGNHDRAATGQITTERFSHTAGRAVDWTRTRLSDHSLHYLKDLPLKVSIEGLLVTVHGALHADVGCELVRLDNDERRLLSFDALAAHPSEARICAFGHTHSVGIFERRDGVMRELASDAVRLRDDAYYLINPGTVGQPRTPDVRASYFILDSARRVLTVNRVEYDASAAFAKSRKAGLLPRSSYVPAALCGPLKRGVRALGVYETLKRSGW